MKKIFNGLGQLFGFLTVLLYAFLALKGLIGFDLPSDVMNILSIIKTFSVLVVVALAGLEFVAGKKLLAFVFFIILAFVIIASFFPDVLNQISGMF